jgi:hypothetical protein
MNPPLNTTGLFLTPRGPYGRRLPERARKHLRASEGEKPDPTSKGMQGLGGQMASGLQAPSVPSNSLAAQMAPNQIAPTQVASNNPRYLASDYGILQKPKYAPPAADDSAVVRRASTEKEKRQLEQSGGAQNGIQVPENAPWWEKLPFKPHVDFDKHGINGGGIDFDHPLK